MSCRSRNHLVLLRKAESLAADAAKLGLGPTPMQIWPIPASRRAKASSTVRTITIPDAPFAKATAAVVKARNTSMTATLPIARVAPSRRLWIEIFIADLRS